MYCGTPGAKIAGTVAPPSGRRVLADGSAGPVGSSAAPPAAGGAVAWDSLV